MKREIWYTVYEYCSVWIGLLRPLMKFYPVIFNNTICWAYLVCAQGWFEFC